VFFREPTNGRLRDYYFRAMVTTMRLRLETNYEACSEGSAKKPKIATANGGNHTGELIHFEEAARAAKRKIEIEKSLRERLLQLSRTQESERLRIGKGLQDILDLRLATGKAGSCTFLAEGSMKQVRTLRSLIYPSRIYPPMAGETKLKLCLFVDGRAGTEADSREHVAMRLRNLASTERRKKGCAAVPTATLRTAVQK
jgi:hypothetical protein